MAEGPTLNPKDGDNVATKKIDIVTWLKNWFEQTSNKVTSWSATTTNDHFPSEKLVKDSLDNKVDKVQGKGLSTEDYTTAEQTKLAGIEAEANKTIVDSALSNSSTNPVENQVINTALDGKAPKDHSGSGNYQYGKGTKTKFGHVRLVDGFTGTLNETMVGTYADGDALSAHAGGILYDAIQGKADSSHNHTVSNITDFPTLATVATSGNYNDLSNKPDLSQAGAVTLTKEQTANTGYFATYTFTQNGSSIGQIDIPKDFLVKSGSVKTVSTANSPVNGYTIGDKYIDLVVNTKDSSGTDEHLYILVSDLVEDTQYEAEESTLTAYTSNGANKFKVKDGGITTTQLNSTLKANIVDLSSITLGPTTGTDAGYIIFNSIS